MTLIKAILFDLGNVLVELDGPPIKPQWLDAEITQEESWRRWHNSQFVGKYETGLISTEQFVDGIIAEQGLKLNATDFVDQYIQWPKQLFPGALDLLMDLRARYTLALYSNTSDMHWPRMMHEMQLDGKFDYYFASFQIGMYKPDVNSFVFIAEKMKLRPERILFLDDNPANVSGARQAGFVSEQVMGIDEVKAALIRNELINPRG